MFAPTSQKPVPPVNIRPRTTAMLPASAVGAKFGSRFATATPIWALAECRFSSASSATQRVGSAAKSFDFGAATVAAGVVLASLAAGAGDYGTLEVLGCSGVMAIRRRIVVVGIHGLNAKNGVVAAERRISSGGPAPANVHAGNVTGKCAAHHDRLNVRRQACGRHGPRHSGQEDIVVEIPRDRRNPDVIDGVEGRGGRGGVRIDGDPGVWQSLIHVDRVPRGVGVLELRGGL